MHGVILPEPHAVKQPECPVQDDVFSDEKDHHLCNERKRGEGAVPVIVESDQAISRGNPEQNRSARDQEADAQITGDHRNDEPVAQIGHEIALAPPWPAGIAGPERGEDGEHRGQRNGNRDTFAECLADVDDKGEQFLDRVGSGALCCVLNDVLRDVQNHV